MVSTPKMENQVFLCIFQKNAAMATLGLKGENAKKVWYYEKWVGRHAYFPAGQSVKI